MKKEEVKIALGYIGSLRWIARSVGIEYTKTTRFFAKHIDKIDHRQGKNPLVSRPSFVEVWNDVKKESLIRVALTDPVPPTVNSIEYAACRSPTCVWDGSNPETCPKCGMPQGVRELTEDYMENALRFMGDHNTHVNTMISSVQGVGYAPTLEDKLDPSLWKPKHWKWFVLNHRA